MAYINLDMNEVIKNFNDPNGDLLRSFIITSIDDTINLKVNNLPAIIDREYSPASLISVEYKGEVTDITLLNNSADSDQCTVEFAVLNVSEHANLINSGYNVLEYDIVNNKVKYQRITNGVIENAETDYTEATNPYLGSFTLKVSDNNTNQICWSEDATITVNFTPECEITPSCSANIDPIDTTNPGRFKKVNFTKDLFADKVMITDLSFIGGPGSYVSFKGLNIFENFYDLSNGITNPTPIVDAQPIIIPFSDFNSFLYYITEFDFEPNNISIKGLDIKYPNYLCEIFSKFCKIYQFFSGKPFNHALFIQSIFIIIWNCRSIFINKINIIIHICWQVLAIIYFHNKQECLISSVLKIGYLFFTNCFSSVSLLPKNPFNSSYPSLAAVCK